MTSKFDTLFESNFSRFQGGGFLTGDVIKLKQGWESDDRASKAPAQLIEKLKELNESDLVLRVSSVKPIRPAVNSSVDQSLGADDFHIDITQESAPGRYTGVFVTVPQHLLELNGPNDKLPDIPDSLKRKENVTIKPEEAGIKQPGDGEVLGDTHATDLPTDNHTLPGAEGATSYSANYIS